MTRWVWIRRFTTTAWTSAWRWQLVEAAAVALVVALMVGGRLAGDSVQGSSRDQARQRLGSCQLVVNGGQRFFGDDLAARLRDELPELSVASVIRLAGTGASGDGVAPELIQVLGVDEGFWAFSDGQAPGAGVAVNRTLARRLGISVGDELLVQVAPPPAMPLGTAFSPPSPSPVTLRVTVAQMLEGRPLASFGLSASRVSPAILFLPRQQLAAAIDRLGRANLLMVGGEASSESVIGALPRALLADDGELEVRTLARQGVVEVRSRQVFLADDVADAAESIAGPGTRLFAYPVDSLRNNSWEIPYAFVVARPWPELAEDEIVLNRWTARELAIGEGERLSMTFRADGSVDSQVHVFTVKQIVDLEEPLIDREMLPPFPGLAEQQRLGDWPLASPLEQTRLREEDEVYWRRYGGLPKAVIPLAQGQELWRHAHGDLTAIRFPLALQLEGRLREDLPELLGVAALGLQVVPVAADASRAVAGIRGPGGWFVAGQIIAGLVAIAMLMIVTPLVARRRHAEADVLALLGFARRDLWLVYAGELLPGLLVGTIAGIGLGVIYTKWVLLEVLNPWRLATGDWQLTLQVKTAGLLTGTLVGMSVCGVVSAAVAWAAAGQAADRWPGQEQQRTSHLRTLPPWSLRSLWKWRRSCLAGGFGLLGLVMLATLVDDQQRGYVLVAFGLLSLIGLLAMGGRWLAGSWTQLPGDDLRWLGLRNVARRPWRNGLIVVFLSAGTCLMLALEAQRPRGGPGPDAVALASRQADLSAGQALLGLALMLGAAGLGLLAVWQSHQRQAEFALMVSLGFDPRASRTMLMVEHLLLLGLGLAVGLLAALPALIPAWLLPGAERALLPLLLVLAVATIGGGSIWLGSWLTTRRT